MNPIDRSEFLQMCQRCVFELSRQGKSDAVVLHSGALYYPIAYSIGFDSNGNPLHKAVLKDLKANSLVECPLSDVFKNPTEE